MFTNFDFTMKNCKLYFIVIKKLISNEKKNKQKKQNMRWLAGY